MENIIFNYDPKYLSEKVIEALGFIKGIVEKNDYVIEKEENFNNLFKYKYRDRLGNASLTTKKRLVHQIIKLEKRPNLHSANRFLHFLRKRILGELDKTYYTPCYTTKIPSIKIKPPVKEQLIQKKREVWKKLRDEAEKARLEYKKEKGDYYKARLYEKAIC